MPSPFDADDVAELRRLLLAATRPRVVALLQGALDTWTPSPVIAAPAPPPAAPAPATTPVSYTSVENYGFASEGEYVEVLLLDLPGVGALPPDAVTVAFTPTSFDLKIHGLGGRNYRLRVPVLEKEIKPEESRVVVGKARVTLRLKARGRVVAGRRGDTGGTGSRTKAASRSGSPRATANTTLPRRSSQKLQSWDYWTHLAAKSKPASSASSAADPMGGVMDIMKDMYEKGDDATKKMIAEAWTKSRTPGGGGAGGLGGFDGGFDGDGALGNLGGSEDGELGL